MTFGSLFAGIGGIDLGLERAGMTCRWQVEIDPYCKRVLAKHWPKVPRYDDIRTVGSANLEPVDLIAGGFPCQDISYAGRGTGLDGERSGLWWEFARVLGEMGPRYVLVENVAALLGRGLDSVLGTLASLGYDAEWHCIPAAAVGAPHIRDRVFVVAYTNGVRCGTARPPESLSRARQASPPPVADADGNPGIQRWPSDAAQEQGGGKPDRSSVASDVADATGKHGQRNSAQSGRALLLRVGGIAGPAKWPIEPDVGRVAHGVPHRVDRLRGLGNAVVPQVAELIGRAIMEVPA